MSCSWWLVKKKNKKDRVKWAAVSMPPLVPVYMVRCPMRLDVLVRYAKEALFAIVDVGDAVLRCVVVFDVDVFLCKFGEWLL